MRFRIIFLSLLISVVMLSCKQTSIDNREMSDKQEFFNETPDATLDFYCAVNNVLSVDQRLSICNLVPDKKETWAELIIRLRANSIDTIKVVGLFNFGHDDKLVLDTVTHLQLIHVLNSVHISEIETLRSLPNGSYINRINLDNFCRGYFFDLDSGVASKAASTQSDTSQ